MKISMISSLPPIKGISPYTLNLLQELSKNVSVDFYGFKSIYPEFMYPGGTKTSEPEPKIENVRIKNYLTWYNPFSWIYVGFKIKTKIVHAQWWSWFLAPMYVTVLSICKLRGKRIIITVHNVKPHEKSILKNFLHKSVVYLGHSFIVHNEMNKKQFIKEYGYKKVTVIPHGILRIPESKQTVSTLRKKYGFTPTDKIILFFGNIRDYKGLDTLLIALGQITDSKYKLLIAGSCWGSFEKYDSLISHYKLENRVIKILRFASNEELAEMGKLCDMIVFPYRQFEASSGAAAQALQFQKPILVSDVGGLSEISPLRFNEESYNGLSKLLLRKNKFNQNNRFEWKAISKKLQEVYKNE